MKHINVLDQPLMAKHTELIAAIKCCEKKTTKKHWANYAPELPVFFLTHDQFRRKHNFGFRWWIIPELPFPTQVRNEIGTVLYRAFINHGKQISLPFADTSLSSGVVTSITVKIKRIISILSQNTELIITPQYLTWPIAVWRGISVKL